MTIIEAMAERAARGELTLSELQASVAILLRDLISREGPSGAVTGSQDDVVTRKTVVDPDAAAARSGGIPTTSR